MKLINFFQVVLVLIILTSSQFLAAQSPDFGAAYAEVSKDQKPKELVSNAIDMDYHGPVDRKAYFPGGVESLQQFIQQMMQYPKLAQRNAVEGTVIVGLKLDKKGEIASSNILQSPGFDLDKEALRIVNKMPNWEPALEDGRPAESKVKIAIVFGLR